MMDLLINNIFRFYDITVNCKVSSQKLAHN